MEKHPLHKKSVFTVKLGLLQIYHDYWWKCVGNNLRDCYLSASLHSPGFLLTGMASVMLIIAISSSPPDMLSVSVLLPDMVLSPTDLK